MANDRTAPGGMGMLLLALLEGRDMYGYEMIEALRARSNEVFRLKAGTLYPLLHSLEAQGWVTSSDGVANGRTRRYYAITRDGRAALMAALLRDGDRGAGGRESLWRVSA